MNEWLSLLDPVSLAMGVLAGLLLGVAGMWAAWRRGAQSEANRADLELQVLSKELGLRESELAEAKQQLAVAETRLEEQKAYHEREKAGLEQAEKRLTESFDRLAGKVFDQRSKQFTDLSEQQLKQLLGPLAKDLDSFKSRVEETHREEVKQHAALRERLLQLEGLNQKLNDEARNLTKALTADVKTQGNWGEQQLEKLLEISGLVKGETYHTQYSVKGKNGERLLPDFVLSLPEGRTIVIDSKVSLTAWTRLQAATDEGEREAELASHVKSVRAHIDILASKNYADAEDLNALDFVLMFVPIEAALIAALRHDPTIPEYALKKKVAILSPANFLATVRTVASVWMIHRQNTHAREIAERAGYLYDKFVGFTENLTLVGARLDQAQKAWGNAMGQLSTGSGNLVGHVEKLKKLGARHQKQLDQRMVEKAEESLGDDPHLTLVEPDEEAS